MDFDRRQVFDSIEPQYKAADNLGFVFDDESIFYKFYDYYLQQSELMGPDEKAKRANARALFLCIDKNAMNILSVLEYDANR